MEGGALCRPEARCGVPNRYAPESDGILGVHDAGSRPRARWPRPGRCLATILGGDQTAGGAAFGASQLQTVQVWRHQQDPLTEYSRAGTATCRFDHFFAHFSALPVLPPRMRRVTL